MPSSPPRRTKQSPVSYSAVISADIFQSALADALCEEAFERLDNVDDIVCETTPLPNGKRAKKLNKGESFEKGLSRSR